MNDETTDWAELSIKLQQLHEDRQDALNMKNYLLAGVIQVQITEWNDKMSLWIKGKLK